MPRKPLSGLTIRSALARGRQLGSIIACDLKKEEKNESHAYIIKWQSGEVTQSEANFNAHSICEIALPQPALLFVSEAGEYGLHYKGGSIAGDVFEDSSPAPSSPRRGGLRSVTRIADKGHAVGYRGMVYRLDRLKGWTRIDEGLPQKFNVEAIDGLSGEDLYAVGNRGQIWQRVKGEWIKHDAPTNVDLNAVKCAGDGHVYAAGNAGVLVRGLKDTWAAVDHGEELDSVWDLEWFDGKLYLSTMDGVWVLSRKGLEPVDFGKDEPKSWYQLSAAEDVLWSVGEYDIMAFDRKRWTRVV